MPAKDRLHDTVVRALVKDGWEVVDEQYLLPVSPKRRLWIDIHAVKDSEQLAVLVEVKGFARMPSPIEYLANVSGKYVLYQAVLEYLQIPMPLYLAVPERAYNGVLNEIIGQQVIKKLNMYLMIFNPQKEEIVRWTPKL